MTSNRLWRVEAPHFVAGLEEAQDGVVVDAAPIISYARNRPLAWFRDYCRRKGWSIALAQDLP